ncbi:hypothetical protein FB004_112213 [Sinorhizobium medicae]|nr:hypothetical protein FB004_112213 [Sinorhizobium medicae]
MTWALARPRGGLEVGGERPESILARAFRGKVLQCRCIIVCEQCGELVADREWNDASSASSSSAQPAIDVDATIVIAAARLRHRDHRAPTSCHVSASEFLPQRANRLDRRDFSTLDQFAGRVRRSFRRCTARPRKCGKGVANPTAMPPAALCLTMSAKARRRQLSAVDMPVPPCRRRADDCRRLYDIVRRLVKSTTQIVPSGSISRSNYLKESH